MIYLGQFNGYSLTVCRSNVEPAKVTYHIYKDGKDAGFSREDAFSHEDGDDALYVEAEKRYNNMGRPEAGDFNRIVKTVKAQHDTLNTALDRIEGLEGDIKQLRYLLRLIQDAANVLPEAGNIRAILRRQNER